MIFAAYIPYEQNDRAWYERFKAVSPVDVVVVLLIVAAIIA
jgi:hypothetical protein